MQQLPPLPLRNGLQQHLRQAQEKIDQLPSYYKKVKQAKVLWQTKKKTNAQKAAFNRIEKALQAAGQHCHYCEGSVGTSIEHFYPRGFYPNLTFVWDNYLWSCQACNTQYKGAKFALFAAPNSAQVLPLVKNRSFLPPTNRDAVFLNPRVDNALDYWELELETGRYTVRPELSKRAQARAQYSLELLQLNERPSLLKGRQEAFSAYSHLLSTAAAVQSDTTGAYLRELLPNKPASFYTQSLLKQQEAAHYFLQQQFLTLPYKTVWRSMQQQAEAFPSLKALFAQAPNTYSTELGTYNFEKNPNK